MRRAAYDWRQQNSVVQQANKEIIGYTLWDRQAFTTASTTSITFFQTQTTGIAGNMQLGGQLPNGFSFRTEAIRLFFAIPSNTETAAAIAAGLTTSVLDDIFNLITTGHAEFRVGEKSYGRWPIFMLPGGAGPAGFYQAPGTYGAGTSQQFGLVQNGVSDPRAVYSLEVPIVIPPQFSFSIICSWAAAITLIGSSPIQVFCMLDGQLCRPAQ